MIQTIIVKSESYVIKIGETDGQIWLHISVLLSVGYRAGGESNQGANSVPIIWEIAEIDSVEEELFYCSCDEHASVFFWEYSVDAVVDYSCQEKVFGFLVN